jgi:hypothetical protein
MNPSRRSIADVLAEMEDVDGDAAGDGAGPAGARVVEAVQADEAAAAAMKS